MHNNESLIFIFSWKIKQALGVLLSEQSQYYKALLVFTSSLPWRYRHELKKRLFMIKQQFAHKYCLLPASHEDNTPNRYPLTLRITSAFVLKLAETAF